jgi:hypothetical protein
VIGPYIALKAFFDADAAARATRQGIRRCARDAPGVDRGRGGSLVVKAHQTEGCIGDQAVGCGPDTGGLGVAPAHFCLMAGSDFRRWLSTAFVAKAPAMTAAAQNDEVTAVLLTDRSLDDTERCVTLCAAA